jgi:hypothetical protein
VRHNRGVIASDYIGLAILGVIVAAPPVGAVLAFLPNPSLRTIGRWLLVFGWLTCGAAVIACIWLATRETSGIGNHIFFLLMIVPAVLGAIWFGIWLGARRFHYVRSLPPAQRAIEEQADIEKAIQAVSRDLRKSEARLRGWFVWGKEKRRLETEVAMLRAMLAQLMAKREKRATA